MQESEVKELTNCKLPFEGEAHQGTIICYPYRKDVWSDEARQEVVQIINKISEYEKVYLIVSKHADKNEIKTCKFNTNVIVLHFEYNDAWARDNTLIFLRTNTSKVKAVDFGFNAWGGSFDGLYPDYADDNLLGSKLGAYFGIETEADKSFILEGGSIHSNGKGIIMTTEACLLSKGRNSFLSKDQIEKHLLSKLNAKKILWLPHGIYQDETNEHVDNVACFLDENTICLAYPKNKDDEQYSYFLADYEYLNKERNLSGEKFKIVFLPLPYNPLYLEAEEAKNIAILDGKERTTSMRLSASYVNFYMSDRFVLLPSFGVPEDSEAYKIMKEIFPNKDIFQMKSKHILIGGGNIHCITMQIPKGKE